MLFHVLTQLLSLLFDLLATKRRSDQQKELEILLLRQQLRILQRQHPTALCLWPWEKFDLAVLAAKSVGLGRGANTKLNQALLLFKPDTVLKWHKLGYTSGRSTIRDILKRQHLAPASQRAKQVGSWSHLLSHYGQQILACDFFTVETAWLKTLPALVFIAIGSRRVHFAGCTAHPTAAWVVQQARQLTWTRQDEQRSMRFWIHDRDAKFPQSFDRVFAAEGSALLRTAYRTPTANAFAERWVRSVREECLDKILISNEAHLRRVVQEYVAYCNQARPQPGIKQCCPLPIDRGR